MFSLFTSLEKVIGKIIFNFHHIIACLVSLFTTYLDLLQTESEISGMKLPSLKGQSPEQRRFTVHSVEMDMSVSACSIRSIY